MLKDVKLKVLQNGYLTFSFFKFLIPQSQNFAFSKINPYKIKKKSKYPKMEYIALSSGVTLIPGLTLIAASEML